MSKSSQSSGDVLYKIETFTITEYIAENDCYKAEKDYGTDNESTVYELYAVNSSAPYNTYNKEIQKQRGYSSNFHNIPQFTRRYEPQSRVLGCVPANLTKNPLRPTIGYIIGEISSTPLSHFADKPTHESSEPIHKSDMSDIYVEINKKNQTYASDYYQGHLNTDTLPGDMTIRGKYTLCNFDNYSTIIGTDTVQTTYCEITGELTEKTRLKNTQDILSKEQIFILGNDSLRLRKEAFDHHTGYLDGFKVEAGNLCEIPDYQPNYTLITAHGSYIAGCYKTLYKQAETFDKNIPVFQECLGLDGSYRLNSCTKLHLSKSTNFYHVDCTGDVFQESPKGCIFKEFDTPMLQCATVDDAASFAPDIDKPEPLTIGSMVNAEKAKASIESFIDFEDDGSIKIRDIWGSYIYLHRGNIQIHAANNLFVVSERDCIQATGGVESHTALQDIQLQSCNASIANYAAKTINYKAKTVGIETRELVINNADKISIQSPNLYINTKQTPSAIYVGNQTTSCIFNTNNFKIKTRNDISLVADNQALIMDTANITIYSNLQVTGDVTLAPKSCVIVDEQDAQTTLYTGHGSVFVTTGGIYANSLVTSATGMLTPYLLAEDVANTKGVIGKIKQFNNQSVKNILARRKKSKDIEISITSKTDDASLFKFNFDLVSKSCTYSAEPCEINSSPSFTYVSEGNYYSYPGKSFWTSSGIVCKNGKSSTTCGFGKHKAQKNNIK